VVTGSYVFGRITLSPCRHCTPAFLTQVYLHELVHAWVDQFRPALAAWDSCPLAEWLADVSFARLGGQIGRRDLCGSYSLDEAIAEGRVSLVADVVRVLASLSEGQITSWQEQQRLMDLGRSHHQRTRRNQRTLRLT
jgi:hypothetical protein